MLLAERVSRTSARASQVVRKNATIIVAGILVAMMCQFLLFAINIPAEAAMAFQCGRLIVEGKTPYIDFFDVSSPALMYVNVIPALFSKMLPFVHPIVVFNFFIVILTAASCFLSAQILFRQRFREQAHVPLFIIGFALLNLIMIDEAGQREHLFLLFYIPFFVCRWLTWTNHKCSKRWSLIAGISGGIAACLDPLCLFGVIAMEIFFLVTKLKFSPFRSREMIAAVAVIALFFLHFALFPTEYAHLYFNWALPLVLCDYKMWDGRLFWVNKTPDLRKLVYLLIFIIVFCLGLRRWCSLIAPCIGLSILGLGLFIIQGKSMTYQALPMIYGAGLAAFLVLSVFFNALIKWKNLQLPLLRPATMIALVSVFILGFIALKLYIVRDAKGIDLSTIGYVGFAFINEKLPLPAVTTYTTILLRDTKVNDRVLILNDRARPAYPLLLQYNRKPVGYLLDGFPMLISRLLIDTNPEKSAEYRGQQFKMYGRLIKDILKEKPTMIMLEKSTDSLGDLLKEHQLMDTIDNLYEESCMAEWPDTDSDPAFDYYAFRCALTVYKLRAVGSQPGAQPATPAAPVAPAPAVPDPAKPAALPAPGVPAPDAPAPIAPVPMAATAGAVARPASAPLPSPPVTTPPASVPAVPAASMAPKPATPAPSVPPTQAPVKPTPSATPVTNVPPKANAAPAQPATNSFFRLLKGKPSDSDDHIDPVTGLPIGAPIEPVAPPSPGAR